jgi:hypothetical protein
MATTLLFYILPQKKLTKDARISKSSLHGCHVGINHGRKLKSTKMGLSLMI